MKLKLYRPIDGKSRFLLASFTFVLFLIVWQAVTYFKLVNEIFLPSPVQVLTAIYTLISNYDLASHVFVSVWRVVVGFVLAAVIAVPLGILIGSIKSFEAMIAPFNDFIRYMPVVAFVPLCILWSGVGDFEKMLVIFLGTVFQLIPMVADTVSAVPRAYVETAASLGFNNLKILRKVIWPAVQPHIFDHLRVAMGWAWSYIVVAEMVAAQRGIGHLIIQSQRFLQTDKVIASIIIVGVLGMVTDQIFRFAAKKLYFWHESKREQ